MSTVPLEKQRASLQRSLQHLSMKKCVLLRALLTAARAMRATHHLYGVFNWLGCMLGCFVLKS